MNTQTVSKHLSDSKRLYLSELASGHTIRKAVEERSKMVHQYFKLDQLKMKQYQDELDFMTAMKSDNKRNVPLHTIAFAALRQDSNIIERIKAQMKAANFNRTTIHRTIKTLTDLQSCTPDVHSLYSELIDHIQSELDEAQKL